MKLGHQFSDLVLGQHVDGLLGMTLVLEGLAGVSACVYEWMHAWMPVCVSGCTRVWMLGCMRGCMHVGMRGCMRVWMREW